MTIKDLQKILSDFEKEYWVAPKDEDGKTRHIVLHLAKLLGKIGGVSEKRDHGFEADKDIIKKEVIPTFCITHSRCQTFTALIWKKYF